MFTGLVQCLGTVREANAFGRGRRFRIDIGALAGRAAIGQSIAVNGACLTVTSLSGPEACFDAVTETVSRTNLGALRPGDRVNLEPALKAGDALDGHLMLGHVDCLGHVLSVESASADSRVIRVHMPVEIRDLVAEKGSVAVDGISLTVAEAAEEWFSVAVIPHSWQNSTLHLRKPGDGVNLEADVLARYVARILRQGRTGQPAGGVTEELLRQNGFL